VLTKMDGDARGGAALSVVSVVGVPIAFGTDAAVYPHGLNAQEFGDMVDLGMSPAAALMSSSQGAAKLLGIDSETGTLELGKFADVVAVPGNVLQDIRGTEKPLLVMKQGTVVRSQPGSTVAAGGSLAR